MTSRWIAFCIVGCAALASLAACGGGGGDGDGENLKNADCQTITVACHDVAGASGKPSECHDIAHEDSATECKAELTACVAACKAEAAKK